jgi:hypothetical protein
MRCSDKGRRRSARLSGARRRRGSCALHEIGGDLTKMTLTGAGFAPRHGAAKTPSDEKTAQSKRGG